MAGGERSGCCGLVARFPLRTIERDAELDAAISMVDSLIERDDLDSTERSYLDVLGELVHDYESTHHAMERPSDADILGHLIEANAMTQAKVAGETGIAESTVSAILAGKREMNRRHVEAFCRLFRVSPSVFIGQAEG